MKQTIRSHLGIVALLVGALALSLTFWACSGDDSNQITSPQVDNGLNMLSRPDFINAVAVHNRHIPDILNTPKVAGTAIGTDEKGKPVITIYTEELLPPGQLRDEYEGFRVVQKVSGPIEAKKGPPPMDGGGGGFDPQAAQTAPIKLGTSGGWRYDLANGFCCGGTLGSLIQIGGTQYVLSNWHVLYADIVNGGNSRVASPGDPVIQPGLIDVGCNASNSIDVATLVSGGGSLPGANIDAGIAQVIPGQVAPDGEIGDIGVLSSSTLTAFNGLDVKKMGRTTGLGRATVTGTNGAFNITYSNECAGGTAFTISYTGQIVTSNRRCNFLDGGDSGSLMVEDVDVNPRAVGLLFAGSSICNPNAIAIANPINEVLSFYGASMVGN